MAETFYVGAYWGPRGESVDACAGRLSSQLLALGDVDPALKTWFKTGRSRRAASTCKVDPTPESVRDLLIERRQRQDDPARTVMTDLGYSASLWNGQQAPVGLSVRCGSAAMIPGMVSNSLSIQLPAAEGAASVLYRRKIALEIVRSVVVAWEPVWCTWTSHRLRAAQQAQPDEIVAGWATYLARADGVPTDDLPHGFTAEQVGTGVLLIADGDADSAPETAMVSIRSSLGPALRSS